MPFTKCSCGITGTFKHICYGVLFGTYNHSRISYRNVCSRFTPCVFSCQHGISGRGTGGSGGMCVGKPDTFGCQAINIRGLHIFCPITFQVTISQIISINKNHIRFVRILLSIFRISCQV